MKYTLYGVETLVADTSAIESVWTIEEKALTEIDRLRKEQISEQAKRHTPEYLSIASGFLGNFWALRRITVDTPDGVNYDEDLSR